MTRVATFLKALIVTWVMLLPEHALSQSVIGNAPCYSTTTGTLVDCGPGSFGAVSATGTANALAVTLAANGLPVGTSFVVVASVPNDVGTTTLTVTLGGGGGTIGPWAITKFGGQALLPHDIFAAGHRLTMVYTGSGFELLNPTFSSGNDVINADNLGIGTGDDTSIWNSIDAQIGAVGSQLPKTVFVSKQTNVKNLAISNIAKLIGIKDRQTFTLASSSSSDFVLWYVGTGPFDVENLSIACGIYDPQHPTTAPPGTYALLVQPSSTSQQVNNVTIRHVRTTGCQNGVVVRQTMYLDMEDIYNDRPWGFGWIVSDQNDSSTVHTRHIRIRDTYGVNAGQYCGSIPVNLPTTPTTTPLSPIDIDIRGVGCDGAGFINQKFCFDLTGSSFTSGHFDGWGRNCYAGGMEIKRTIADSVGVPDALRNIDVSFRYDSNIDQGSGVWWAFQITGASQAANKYSQVKGRLFVNYNAPDLRQENTTYEAGAVFQANGGTYKVATPGKTGLGTGPTTTGNGISDGTAQVDYLQATPTAATQMIAGTVEAITDAELQYTFNGTAYGVMLQNRGSSDKTIRRLTLSLRGWAERSCLRDSANASGPVEMLVVDGSCRTLSSSPGFSVFSFGNKTGMAYTQFDLRGGPWYQAGESYLGVINLKAGSSLAGTIAGGVHMVASRGIILNQGNLDLIVGGGGVWDITSSNGRQAVYMDTGSSGTVEVGGVRLKSVVSSSTVAYDSWINLAGISANVFGRFVRGFKSAAPTDHCNSGDLYWSAAPGVGGQPAQGWYCSTPGTTWTAF